MTKYLTTKLHVYDIAPGSTEWRELHARLTDGRHPLHAFENPLSKQSPLAPGVYTVALETSPNIFDNQWDTADDAGDKATRGRRVFDWYESMRPSARGVAHTGRGHWLEITAGMLEARRNTMACGYCGKQEPAAKGNVFCPHCIDSPYLKESELHLLRMMPVAAACATRAPLTEAEAAHLVPIYREAQIHGATARGRAAATKARTDAVEEAARTIRGAKDKRDGVLWLLDHGVSAENVIYYAHTERFCFGWRRAVSAAEYSALCDVLTEFPFDYDIKRE